MRRVRLLLLAPLLATACASSEGPSDDAAPLRRDVGLDAVAAGLDADGLDAEVAPLDGELGARDAQPLDAREVPDTRDITDARSGPDVGPADPRADLLACEGYVGVPQFWDAPNRNIELLAFGDTQFAADRVECARKDEYRDDQNPTMIAALNGIESAVWPFGHGFAREGRAFRNVRGVVLAGDITENGDEQYPEHGRGSCGEWTAFRSTFGLCADRDLRYPVYEGFGNHDFPMREDFDTSVHPVLGYISRRNPYRVGVTAYTPPADERAHYSWDWDDIHFVQLNVKPSGTPGDRAYEDIDRTAPMGPGRRRRIDPRQALAFLDEDLRTHLGPTRQVVLVSHYGPSNGSRLPRAERTALCDVLTRHDARVIAWIHGHTHKSDVYEWSCAGRTVPVINVGSPFYEEGANGGRLHFAVIRIGNAWLEAVDVSFSPGAPTDYEIPGHQTPNPWLDTSDPPDGIVDPDPYNPDQLWGGWTLRHPVDPPRP